MDIQLGLDDVCPFLYPSTLSVNELEYLNLHIMLFHSYVLLTLS